MSLEPLRGGGSSWQNGQRPIRPVVNSMDETRRKIDEYDKGLPRTWAEATLPWVARSVAGELADKRYYLPENNRLFQALPQRVVNTLDTSLTYNHLFGIDEFRVVKPEHSTWASYLGRKENYLEYYQAVKENVKHAHLPAISPMAYCKHTVLELNFPLFPKDSESLYSRLV